MGSGTKVVARNQELPFADGVFQIVCVLDSANEVIAGSMDEFKRVIPPEGLLVLSTNVLDFEAEERLEPYQNDSDLEPVDVPDEFQRQGDSESQFYVFRKKPTQ